MYTIPGQRSFVRQQFTPQIQKVRRSNQLQIVCGKESSIGKRVIPVPQGVKIEQWPVKQSGEIYTHLEVSNPAKKISLNYTFLPEVAFKQDGDTLHCLRMSQSKTSKAQHGTARALASNMIVGVTQGFKKSLEITGVGYRASLNNKGTLLILSLGKAHLDILDIPPDLEVKVESYNIIHVSGYDKYRVGWFAASIRDKKPPEPYKGKGIRYQGEVIKLKQGKKGK